MPKVSFVIPVYDGDAYLAETIESIRNQTEKDIEIIVIDDCSPDFTPDLMGWYIEQDSRIKYHRFDNNLGVCEARNYGNSMATADIICVSDQDDLSKPWRAAYSYLYLTHHPEVDCITSSYWECDVDGKPVNPYKGIADMTREKFDEGKTVWMHSSCAYRKKDILEIPYREEQGATDDWAFLDDWTRAGKKFKTLRPVLANCRRVPWGQMQQRRQIQGAQPSFIL
jgi:glycosyltransferase involved in cell wall biosynthesis